MSHISHMCMYGCMAYAKFLDQRRMKLDTKSIKCLFLRCCKSTKKKMIKSPDVVVFEELVYKRFLKYVANANG